MSCCGKKREEFSASLLKKEKPSGTSEEISEKLTDKQQDTRFRYTGNTLLTVHGFLNARTYYFSADNPEIVVDAIDVNVMRGYADLMESK